MQDDDMSKLPHCPNMACNILFCDSMHATCILLLRFGHTFFPIIRHHVHQKDGSSHTTLANFDKSDKNQ